MDSLSDILGWGEDFPLNDQEGGLTKDSKEL